MRILVLSTKVPWPPTDGVKIPVFELLRGLSSRHKVFLICFSEDDSEIGDQLGAFCQNVQVFHPLNGKKQILPWFPSSLTKGMPPSVAPYDVSRAQQAAAQLVTTENIDVVVYHLIHTAPFYTKLPHIPSCMIIQDSVYRVIQQNAQYAASAWKRVYLVIHAKLMMKYEAIQYPHFDKCCVVSEIEREHVLKLNREIDVEVVPNGVDTEYFCPEERGTREFALVYVGDLSAGRNEQAAWHLATEIFPILRSRFPGLTLRIVGKKPSVRLKKLGSSSEDIRVTGMVDDIRPFVRTASLFISPQETGTGIKNSILQALSMGLPVIASPASVEGIKGIEGRDYLVCRTTSEYIEAASRLLNDPIARCQLGLNGRRLVLKNYQWSHYVRSIEQLCEQAIDKRAREGSSRELRSHT